jgi:hypothetical protein
LNWQIVAAVAGVPNKDQQQITYARVDVNPCLRD